MKKYFTFVIISVLMTTIRSSSAQENPNIFKYKVGDFDVFLLSEGQQTGKSSILIGASGEIIKQYTSNGSFPNATNAFLVKTPDKNVLIDAGYGKEVTDNLKSTGLNPEDIDIVLITHMHGDHIGGLLSDGEIAFPSAVIYLPEQEYNYWMSDEEMKKLPENKHNGFINVRNVVKRYGDKIKLFHPYNLGEASHELLPGISGIFTPGHTPGHTAFLVKSGQAQLLIWGDLTHAMAVQMPHPEISVTYDVDPDMARISRMKILEYVAQNKIPIAGMHIAFPAIGTIVSREKGFEFIPVK